jgi:hypothetical protein
MVVNDPVSQGINLMGFLNSLESMMTQITTANNIFSTTEESMTSLQSARDAIETVNSYFTDAQEIADAVYDLSQMGKQANEIVKMMVQSRVKVSITSKTAVLDAMTSFIARGTNNLALLYRCVTGYNTASAKAKGTQATDSERSECVRHFSAKIRRDKERAAELAQEVKEEVEFRGYINNLVELFRNHPDCISPTKLAYIAAQDAHWAFHGAGQMEFFLIVDEYDECVMRKNLSATENEKTTYSSVSVIVRSMDTEINNYFMLYYVICALIGLIGGYKVYSKVMMGEDLGKSAAIWVGTAFFLFFMGIFIQYFFF